MTFPVYVQKQYLSKKTLNRIWSKTVSSLICKSIYRSFRVRYQNCFKCHFVCKSDCLLFHCGLLYPISHSFLPKCAQHSCCVRPCSLLSHNTFFPSKNALSPIPALDCACFYPISHSFLPKWAVLDCAHFLPFILLIFFFLSVSVLQWSMKCSQYNHVNSSFLPITIYVTFPFLFLFFLFYLGFGEEQWNSWINVKCCHFTRL